MYSRGKKITMSYSLIPPPSFLSFFPLDFCNNTLSICNQRPNAPWAIMFNFSMIFQMALTFTQSQRHCLLPFRNRQTVFEQLHILATIQMSNRSMLQTKKENEKYIV